MSQLDNGRVCQGCGAALPPKTWRGRDRKWCSNRCRKAQYDRECIECGDRVDGTTPSRIRPEGARCVNCVQWTRKAVLLAFEEWADSHGGVPPTCTDVRRSTTVLPYEGTVSRLFGSWNSALLEAGFELRCDRRPETMEAILESIASGERVVDIAARHGVSDRAIYQRLTWRGLSIADVRGSKAGDHDPL